MMAELIPPRYENMVRQLADFFFLADTRATCPVSSLGSMDYRTASLR